MNDLGGVLAQIVAARAAGQDTQSLIASQLGDDPTAAMLLQAVAQRQSQSDAGNGDDDAAPDVDSMQHELQTLRERCDSLAAALGACYLCWGEDLECPNCAGHGMPGSYPIDPGLFEELIVPAVRRARARTNAYQRTTETNERN